MNSRPLFYISSDPEDLAPITHAHFLIGKSLTSVPDPDLTDLPENRLSRFQRIQFFLQHIWQRWSKEYVSELQQRQKWKTSTGELQVDDLVLIKEDNVPPFKWRLGRIVSLHPGSDGVNRVASIRTIGGVIKRAFAKICPLPSSDI